VAAADGHEEAVEEKRALRHTAARLLIHELYVPDWFARALEWRTYEPARLSELAAAAASFRIRSLSLLSALLRCVDALHSPVRSKRGSLRSACAHWNAHTVFDADRSRYRRGGVPRLCSRERH
jgi:hypothetical protein